MTTITGNLGAFAPPIHYKEEANPRAHCTQFMLDRIPERAAEPPSEHVLTKYMQREPGYDLAFIRAWFEYIKSTFINNPARLLNIFVDVQKIAMSHITANLSEADKTNFDQSFAKGHSFCVGVGPNSNFYGIMSLVKQILYQGKNTLVSFYTTEQPNKPHIDYGVMSGEFFQLNRRTNERNELFPENSHGREKRLQEITKIIKPLYETVTEGEGAFSVRITSLYTEQPLRKLQALRLMVNYLVPLTKATSHVDKIKKICVLCRELEQLHMFADGNGRTVFIFANLLLSMNNLPPFYPNNMCIFDANSLCRMVREVIEGQKRFREMFGTKEEFNHNLEAYKNAVENLSALILTKFAKIKLFSAPFSERNFNLLLRQSAVKETTVDLLKFLVENRVILNIDLTSTGSSSGTVLDIAKKHGNQKACTLLAEAL